MGYFSNLFNAFVGRKPGYPYDYGYRSHGGYTGYIPPQYTTQNMNTYNITVTGSPQAQVSTDNGVQQLVGGTTDPKPADSTPNYPQPYVAPPAYGGTAPVEATENVGAYYPQVPQASQLNYTQPYQPITAFFQLPVTAQPSQYAPQPMQYAPQPPQYAPQPLAQVYSQPQPMTNYPPVYPVTPMGMQQGYAGIPSPPLQQTFYALQPGFSGAFGIAGTPAGYYDIPTQGYGVPLQQPGYGGFAPSYQQPPPT